MEPLLRNDSTSCLNIANQTFVTNVATRGNLCLRNGGAITGTNTRRRRRRHGDDHGPRTHERPEARRPPAPAGRDPTNVYSSNSVYATNAIATNATGANQDTTGFGFAIPSTAVDHGDHRHRRAHCERVLQRGADDHDTGGPTGGTFKLNATPPGRELDGDGLDRLQRERRDGPGALVTDLRLRQRDLHGRAASRTAVACTFAGADASAGDHADDDELDDQLARAARRRTSRSRTPWSAPTAR